MRLNAGDKVSVSDANGNCFKGLTYVKQITEHNGVKSALVIFRDAYGQAELIFIYQPVAMQWTVNWGDVKLFLEK